MGSTVAPPTVLAGTRSLDRLRGRSAPRSRTLEASGGPAAAEALRTLRSTVVRVGLARLGGMALSGLAGVLLALAGLGLPDTSSGPIGPTDQQVADAIATLAPQRDTGPHATGEEMLATILDRSLFDKTSVGGPDREEDAEDAETDLPYLLLATVVATPERFSAALIVKDERGAEGRGYGIGDELEPGVTLVQIQSEQVVLQREDGSLEILGRPDPDELREKRRNRSAGGKVVFRRAGKGKYEVSDAALAKLYEDPDKGLGKVRVRPYRSRGVRLSRVSRRSPLRKMGIRSGDILTAFNGRQIRNKADLLVAMKSLASTSSFEVELQRRRKRRRRDVTLSYEVL